MGLASKITLTLTLHTVVRNVTQCVNRLAIDVLFKNVILIGGIIQLIAVDADFTRGCINACTV